MTAQPQTAVANELDELDQQLLNPPELPTERTVFGQITVVDRWFCVLEKGTGKRLYDATRDSLDQRRVAIKLQVTAPKRDGGTYTIDREMVDFSDEWKKFTLPSIQRLNVPISNLLSSYCRMTLKKSGSYVKNNETKELTAIVFDELYPDEATCRAASAEYFKTPASNGNSASPQAAPAQAPAGSQPENSAERDFAASTLPMLWTGCGEDRKKFLQTLATSPVMAKYFNENSPEVQALPNWLPF